jgi:hypothetical protein
MKIIWWRVIATLFVMSLVLWHPLARVLIWHALPLGSGPDDFIFLAVCLFAIGMLTLTARGIAYRRTLWRLFVSLFTAEKMKNERNTFFNEELD